MRARSAGKAFSTIFWSLSPTGKEEPLPRKGAQRATPIRADKFAQDLVLPSNPEQTDPRSNAWLDALRPLPRRPHPRGCRIAQARPATRQWTRWLRETASGCPRAE